MKNDKEKQTLVEEGTEFTGTMRARCKVVVRGSMDGELEAPAVEVTEGGTMTGSVKAERVDSRGVLAGSVEADEISLAGVVRSDTVIRARTLSVNLSSEAGRLEVTFGDTVLEVGDMSGDRPSASDRDDEAAESAASVVQLAEAGGAASSESEPVQAADSASEKGRKNGKARKSEADQAEEDVAAEGESIPAP